VHVIKALKQGPRRFLDLRAAVGASSQVLTRCLRDGTRLRRASGGTTKPSRSVVEVRGPKRRAILALLAFAEGRTVTVDHLIDALCPRDAPESARQALHTHVDRLRAQLGPAVPRLETRQDGYRLDLGTDGLDLSRAPCSRRPGRRHPGSTHRGRRTRTGAARSCPTSPTWRRSPSPSRAAPVSTGKSRTCW
jgi:hypothetical protein